MTKPLTSQERMAENALKFDPDPEYRAEAKRIILAAAITERKEAQ